jgi:predicted nucleic acid-binding protein
MVPSSGIVYIDTSCIIYSVERHADYYPLLLPLWIAAKSGEIQIVSSQLTIMESLTGPLRSGNPLAVEEYEELFRESYIRFYAVSESILRDAATLRARTSLRTPDAIHGATALQVGANLLVTNDAHFSQLSGISIAILKDN